MSRLLKFRLEREWAMRDAHEIRLEIPGEAEYVGIVRHTVAGIASRMSFDAEEVDDLKLAVGEACNNAVKHGCPSEHNPLIVIICKVTPSHLEIEITNGLSGGESCPSLVGSVDHDKEGGMGLFIMRKLMDQVDIVWEEQTARIRMVKSLKAGRANVQT